jgi:NAD-dependent dihydropyrimidine dehydrogenase PreA subunit
MAEPQGTTTVEKLQLRLNILAAWTQIADIFLGSEYAIENSFNKRILYEGYDAGIHKRKDERDFITMIKMMFANKEEESDDFISARDIENAAILSKITTAINLLFKSIFPSPCIDTNTKKTLLAIALERAAGKSVLHLMWHFTGIVFRSEEIKILDVENLRTYRCPVVNFTMKENIERQSITDYIHNTPITEIREMQFEFHGAGSVCWNCLADLSFTSKSTCGNCGIAAYCTDECEKTALTGIHMYHCEKWREVFKKETCVAKAACIIAQVIILGKLHRLSEAEFKDPEIDVESIKYNLGFPLD